MGGGRAAGLRTAATTWLRCCAAPVWATGCGCWAIATTSPAVLAAADIFVLPSHFEGLPMSVIEAMLTGLPVVASDIRGPREQVVPEVTGLLVPVADPRALASALRRLAEDATLRARMGAAGRVRAIERYDETTVLTRTMALLGL